MNKNSKQIQQGDVNGEYIDALPKDVKKVNPPKSGFMVSQGSTEGNRHIIKVIDKATMSFYNGKEEGYRYVVNKSRKKVQLIHEGPSADHKPITLSKGIIEFTPVYEINHLTKMVAPVVD